MNNNVTGSGSSQFPLADDGEQTAERGGNMVPSRSAESPTGPLSEPTAKGDDRASGGAADRACARTIKDIPALDSGGTRRLRLDPNQSYGMQVRRPTAGDSGAYSIVNAPSAGSEEDGKAPEKPRCASCGVEAVPGRLTCPSCGSYLSMEVQGRGWESSKQPRSVLAADEGLFQFRLDSDLVARLIARAVDLMIIAAFSSMLIMGYLRLLSGSSESAWIPADLVGGISSVIVPSIALATALLYSTLFESSPFQGTPGKIALGLAVSTGDGKELDFLNAFKRSFIALSPVILMVLTYWGSLLTGGAGGEELSRLDLILSSQTIVLVGIFALLAYATGLAWAFTNPNSRTLWDYLSGTRIERK